MAVNFHLLVEVVQSSFRYLCMVLQYTSEKSLPRQALKKYKQYQT